ncbi:hypothetical protein GOBAR_AA19448 [Gossypium barbadense]|uniref:Uncharacterized protein n=1 Tax=Gossypium barbadense TaxID=3634 RepID=A0A2P5XD01_GOSBA|nr:hypothetical protein GOBAR_AA19448 [Gossypium barbadense]
MAASPVLSASPTALIEPFPSMAASPVLSGWGLPPLILWSMYVEIDYKKRHSSNSGGSYRYSNDGCTIASRRLTSSNTIEAPATTLPTGPSTVPA